MGLFVRRPHLLAQLRLPAVHILVKLVVEFLRSIAIAIKNAADAGVIRAAGRIWEWLELKQLVEVQVDKVERHGRLEGIGGQAHIRVA